MTRKVRAAKRTPGSGGNGSDQAALPDSLNVGYGVARLARLIARNATRRVAEETGLTLAEWRVLLLMGEKSAVFLDALADRALLEKSHASIAAAALARKKLVRRVANPRDRRRILLSRTATGTRLVSRYIAATAEERRDLWGVLSAAEQATLADFISRLLGVAERESLEAPLRRPYRSRSRR
jgi:DNA-binding MarR family transcriptional regulator